MEQNVNQKDNLLEVFAEAEKQRVNRVLAGLTEKDKMISLRQEIAQADIDNIQCMFDRIGCPDISETLKLHNLTSAEVFVFNESLKEMIVKLAVEMIRQGLIVLEVEDNKYNPNIRQLSIITSVINPKVTAKRINIQKHKEQ